MIPFVEQNCVTFAISTLHGSIGLLLCLVLYYNLCDIIIIDNITIFIICIAYVISLKTSSVTIIYLRNVLVFMQRGNSILSTPPLPP